MNQSALNYTKFECLLHLELDFNTVSRNPASITINQNSASSVNTLSSGLDMTPHFWYSPTFFSKKLVLPSREMRFMKSNGFFVL